MALRPLDQAQQTSLLVLAHDAFYGASRVAIDVCKCLSQRGWRFVFVLMEGGPLIHEFNSLGRVHLLHAEHGRPLSVKTADELNRIARESGTTRIYASTVAVCPILEALDTEEMPVLLHVHELAFTTDMYARNHASTFIERPAHYLAASQAVATHLTRDWGIAEKRVTVAYEGIDGNRVEALLQAPTNTAVLRTEPSQSQPKPDFEMLVAGAGTCQWRKGTDLWLQVASELARLKPTFPVRFVWFGPVPTRTSDDDWLRETYHTIRLLGLTESVRFIEYRENYYPLLQQCDVFTLCSREDPCPLVVLDAMYLGLPVIAFESGGASEVLAGDAGVIVPHYSPHLMARSLMGVLRDNKLRNRLSGAGKKRARTQYTIERLARVVETQLTRIEAVQPGVGA